MAVVHALDAAYDIEEDRPYLRVRAVALGLSVGTVVVIAVVLGMVVVGPLLGTGHDVSARVGLGGAFATAWDWARWPVVLALIVVWTATIFHVAPNHRKPWRWDLPGAALTTVGWVGVSLAFRVYLAVVAGGNQVLGTLGGALIVLLWFYALAMGLIVGGELNAILARRHGVAELPRRELPSWAALVRTRWRRR